MKYVTAEYNLVKLNQFLNNSNFDVRYKILRDTNKVFLNFDVRLLSESDIEKFETWLFYNDFDEI